MSRKDILKDIAYSEKEVRICKTKHHINCETGDYYKRHLLYLKQKLKRVGVKK